MRSKLVLFCLTLMSASAFAQREPTIEVTMGIGKDLVPPPGVFKSNQNLSMSVCYKLTDEWDVAVFLGREEYKLYRLTSENQSFLDGQMPQVSRTVTSILAGGRYFIPSKSKILHPYFSIALGYGKSASSRGGYYVLDVMARDTVFYQVQGGHFLLGLVSLGAQVRPLSFIVLFAELQASVASVWDLSPGPIAGRVGIGVRF